MSRWSSISWRLFRWNPVADVRRSVRESGGWSPYLKFRLGPQMAYNSVISLQTFFVIHLILDHVFEVRKSTGASMLPTLALNGDYVVYFRLPFVNLIGRLDPSSSSSSSSNPYYGKHVGGSKFSKYDQSQGTGLKIGDLVVAISPYNPDRTVCKRVLGLPGDTICLDPRFRPIPLSAWRGQKEPSPVNRRQGKGTEDTDPLGARMTKYEDLLASLGVETRSQENSSSSHASPSASLASSDIQDIDLLKSMDTDQADETESYNQVTSKALQHTYIRSKGDVQYITIPAGHVWLAGDNMGNSTDSRHYGPVPLGLIRGKAVARFWPNPSRLRNNLQVVE